MVQTHNMSTQVPSDHLVEQAREPGADAVHVLGVRRVRSDSRLEHGTERLVLESGPVTNDGAYTW